MAAWNTEQLYGNDLASDIKPEVKAVFSLLPVDEGVEKICSFYKDKLDADEAYILWFVIGDVLWSYGLLTDEIKTNILDRIAHLELQEADIVYSAKFVAEFKEKIASDQPKRKKVAKPRTHHSKWKEGDVLAYRLLNKRLMPDSCSSAVNQYMLMRVVSVWTLPVSHIMETELYDEFVTVMVYNWVGELTEIPELDDAKTEYLPVRIQNKPDGTTAIYMKGSLPDKPSGQIEWELKVLGNVGKYDKNLFALNNGGDIVALELILKNLECNGYILHDNHFEKA